MRPVSLHGVSAALAVARNLGVADSTVLLGSGVSVEKIHRASYMVSMEQELVVFENARRALPDSHLGLRIGYSMPISTLGLLGYTMLLAPNLEQALHCGLSFPIQLASQFDPVLERHGGEQLFVAKDFHGFVETHSFSVDVFLSASLRLIRDCLQMPEYPCTVHFKRAAPADVEAYKQLFKGDVVFASPSDALLLTPEMLECELPLADPISYTMMLEATQRKEQEMAELGHSGFCAQVFALLKADLLAYGELKAVAQALYVSERTLGRRLTEEGFTFKRLHAIARHQRANQLLGGSNLPLDVIANQLGFADLSTFVHAYRKWAGVSPGRLRKSLRGSSRS